MCFAANEDNDDNNNNKTSKNVEWNEKNGMDSQKAIDGKPKETETREKIDFQMGNDVDVDSGRE